LQVQLDNALLAAGASELAGHIKHSESDVAPTVVEYLPVPQAMQGSAPADAVYFPATHWVHMPPFGRVKPALHLQSVDIELPAGESAFARHAEHVEALVAPTAAEYLPDSHTIQSDSAALPTVGEYLAETHARQVFT